MRLRLQRFKFSIKLVPRCESTSPQAVSYTHLVGVSAGQRRRLENGAPVRCAEDAPARVRILADGRFLGVGRTQGGELRAEKLFAEREGSNAVHQNIVED